ncbi:uncharacterized protein LOC116295601 [Actinia tenebrosa]|uniref:Uncharacterized protein LOC116295601 n=1 Tax=Actinia tenebrosa TaxID=6105 RepID=A0A6P8I356_ACTTE|nr:uncharacterized protein LOC116295601 [Actinia tenebrosa]
MDFSSGLLWSELNDILMSTFDDELGNTASEEKVYTQVVQSLINYVEENVNASDSILISGSFAETTNMHPYVRQHEAEFDIMIATRHFIISRDMQPAIFKDIPDEPGFVRVEASDIRENESIEVKEVIHSGGRSSHFYIVPNRKMFQYQPNPIYKNILVQSMCDTLGIEKLSVMEYQQGPALTGSFLSLLPSIESISTHPKNTLFKFLGHLGTRVLEHFDHDKTETEKNNLNGEFKEHSFWEAFNVMKTTHPKEIPWINKLVVDFCPAIKCEGWPHKALRFFHRTRVWPDHTMLNKLLQSGFHLVYKPLNPLSQDSVEWRISFSQTEVSLFQSMDDFRVCCYRIFKAIYYSELTLPKVLCSYHMKTIFLWACERIPSEMWVKANLAQIIMGLLDDLLHCLVTKSCPHYFIPENNLFAHVHQDFLDHLAKVVAKIRRNPKRYLSVLKNRNTAVQDKDVGVEDVSSMGDIELD